LDFRQSIAAVKHESFSFFMKLSSSEISLHKISEPLNSMAEKNFSYDV